MLEVGLEREQNRGERREEHRQPGQFGEPEPAARGVPGLDTAPHAQRETGEVQRVPQEPCSHRTDGIEGCKRREERGLKRRTDEAVSSAATGIQRLGSEEPASTLEEDRGIAALVDGVSRAQHGEEDREERKRSGPGWRRRGH